MAFGSSYVYWPFHGKKRIWMVSRAGFVQGAVFAIKFQDSKELFTYISARFLSPSEVPNMQ